MKRPWYSSRYNLGICLDERRKTMETSARVPGLWSSILTQGFRICSRNADRSGQSLLRLLQIQIRLICVIIHISDSLARACIFCTSVYILHVNVDTVNRPRTGRLRNRGLISCSGEPSACYSMGAGGFSPGSKATVASTCPYRVPKLRVDGVYLYSLCAFTA
jgi:hypothetical protein